MIHQWLINGWSIVNHSLFHDYIMTINLKWSKWLTIRISHICDTQGDYDSPIVGWSNQGTNPTMSPSEIHDMALSEEPQNSW